MPNKTVTIKSDHVVKLPKGAKIIEAKINNGIQAVIEYDKANENIYESREFVLGYNGYTPPEGSVIVVQVRNSLGTYIPLYELRPIQIVPVDTSF